MPYQSTKFRFPMGLALVRVGDFFEAFRDDAKALADTMGIVLASRNETPMAGVPVWSLHETAAKLNASGHSVAAMDKDGEISLFPSSPKLRTYETEFPDFPAADMPEMPASFADSSWKNDACPSFQNEARDLRLYVDYADSAKREFPDAPRFSLHVAVNASGEIISFDANDWGETLSLLTVEAVARRFADTLRDWLDDHEWRAMCGKVAEYAPMGACPSHDYCDANMAMHPAMALAGYDTSDDCDIEAQCNDDRFNAIWNRAWDMATQAYFRPDYQPLDQKGR